jgi:hypothetical protein
MLEYIENIEKEVADLKWTSPDMEMYSKSKEYVDSILFPLIPLSFDKNITSTAVNNDVINLLAHQLEKQFKGRLLLLPGFVYMEGLEAEELINHLWQWEQEIKKRGFTHLFYLTSNQALNNNGIGLSGTTITIPEIENQQNFNAILEDKIKEISSLFFEKWQGIQIS